MTETETEGARTETDGRNRERGSRQRQRQGWGGGGMDRGGVLCSRADDLPAVETACSVHSAEGPAKALPRSEKLILFISRNRYFLSYVALTYFSIAK